MLALLAVTLLSGFDSSETAKFYREMKLKYDTWISVCLNLDQYSCIMLAVPKVEYKVMRRGLLGYFDGSDTVYVNKTLKGDKRRATLYHEMVHYLQHERGGLQVPGPAEPICRAEAEAFKETDEWLEAIGRRDLKRGPKWWRPYRHCYPWYGPKSGGFWIF
jgi:hypothetical protein